MLQVGDKVVYPMHGAGVITEIVQNIVNEQTKDYYVLQMLLGKMKVMVPVDGAGQVGLRNIIGQAEIKTVEEVLLGEPEVVAGTWNKRFHAIQAQMKSGDIKDVAAVVRNLVLQERNRKISSGERRLLELARQIVVSELIYACGNTQEDAEGWLDEVLARNKS